MAYPIELREVPLFLYFEETARRELAKIFSWKHAQEGDILLSFGKPVPGIFILAKGEVSVQMPQIEHPLATLKAGQCFGEMALVEETESASASVVVLTKEASFMYCSVDDFKQLLMNTPGCAYSFYKGASILLSSRLRHVNAKLNNEIASIHGMISQMLVKSQVSLQLSETMSELNQTGTSIVGKLIEVIPLLTHLEKNLPQSRDEIARIQKIIEDVFLIDSQNFDRISQQLNLISQQFENIKRVANGGTAISLTGDKHIFRSTSGF